MTTRANILARPFLAVNCQPLELENFGSKHLYSANYLDKQLFVVFLESFVELLAVS